MDRLEWQTLADVRLAESAALLATATPFADGAYYLAGYAIECALKACIAKTVKEFDWPDKKFVADCHTHDIQALTRLANLESARAVDASASPQFAQNWTVVKDWNERSRYQRFTLGQAQKLFDAVNDAKDGVLPWIKVRW